MFVLWMTLNVRTEYMRISFCLLANTGVSMCMVTLENVFYVRPYYPGTPQQVYRLTDDFGLV